MKVEDQINLQMEAKDQTNQKKKIEVSKMKAGDQIHQQMEVEDQTNL